MNPPFDEAVCEPRETVPVLTDATEVEGELWSRRVVSRVRTTGVRVEGGGDERGVEVELLLVVKG